MAGGDEAAASADKHASTREDQLKLWTAGITLAGVLAGFIATGVQLFFQRGDIQRQSQDLQRLSQDIQRQSQDLQGIEQNFRNLSAHKKALTKPLEGLWNFDIKYTKYFGKQTRRHTCEERLFFCGTAILQTPDIMLIWAEESNKKIIQNLLSPL
jgi:hypothetical protein